MLGIKHVLTRMTSTVMQSIAVIGLLGCLILAFLPLGCARSIRNAPIRYRAQHQYDAHLLRDITVERLQECVEAYGEQLGPLDPPFSHANGHVQVTPEGKVLDVQLTGIPDRAPDLAACTRITLREMTVPASVLSLRQKQTADSTNEQTVPRGNEIGNPIVLWEIGAAMAEFAAEHGGRIVLYTVTIEVLTAAAVTATQHVLATKRTHKQCLDHYVACVASKLYRDLGRGAGDSRCSLCAAKCRDNKGVWPEEVGSGPCTYWNQAN
jgi:hypothetical protein